MWIFVVFKVLSTFKKLHCDHGPMFVGRVILIWMLFSIMLGNFLLCKSWARKLLYQNTSSSMFCVEPNLCALWRRKRKIFLKVLDIIGKKIHWEEVETMVWHTRLEMKNKKYSMHYRMIFDVFNN